MDELLQKDTQQDWQMILKEHLQQVAFFQHERLIHLIVTITFALLEMLAIGVFVITSAMGVGVLAVAIFILLAPYIQHYYLLENEVQKMYVQYDEILRKLGEKI